MLRIRSQGWTRQGEGRHENQDAFRVVPALGLFVVVDAMTAARAAGITLDVFEDIVRKAYDAKRLDGALTEAARMAHNVLKHLKVGERGAVGAGAEFAALLFHDGRVRVAWCGNCQIHRLRLEAARTLSDAHWSDPILTGCLGAERLEVSERLLTVDHGDRYVMATDGAIRLYAGVGPFDRDDALTLEVAGMPLDRIGPALMSRACPDDDATVLAVDVEILPDARGIDVAALVRAALAEERARGGIAGLTLRSVWLDNAELPPGIAPRHPFLRMTFEGDPRQGEARARALASRFAERLRELYPEFGGPHQCFVEPAAVVDAALAERVARIEAVASTVLARHRHLYLAPITPVTAWDPSSKLRVVVVRDDEPGGSDEIGAARELAEALRELDPELADAAVVSGEYCK